MGFTLLLVGQTSFDVAPQSDLMAVAIILASVSLPLAAFLFKFPYKANGHASSNGVSVREVATLSVTVENLREDVGELKEKVDSICQHLFRADG